MPTTRPNVCNQMQRGFEPLKLAPQSACYLQASVFNRRRLNANVYILFCTCAMNNVKYPLLIWLHASAAASAVRVTQPHFA